MDGFLDDDAGNGLYLPIAFPDGHGEDVLLREEADRERFVPQIDVTRVLYNPASRSRRDPWKAAVAALQRHRPPQTPVASVRRAYRQGQEVALSEVGRMLGISESRVSQILSSIRRTLKERIDTYDSVVPPLRRAA